MKLFFYLKYSFLAFLPHLSPALHLGVESFLMYSVHEGIRGIPLEPSDKMDALMPISGTSFAVGIDFHAGKQLFIHNLC